MLLASPTVVAIVATLPLASNVKTLFARVAAAGSSMLIESASVIGLRTARESTSSFCCTASHSRSKSAFTSAAKKSPDVW